MNTSCKNVKLETTRKGCNGFTYSFPGEFFKRSFMKNTSLFFKDVSFMKILRYCQKFRLVFDLGITLTVIQENVGTDEGNENKC